MNILHIMVDIKQEGDVGERKREKYIYTKLCLCVRIIDDEGSVIILALGFFLHDAFHCTIFIIIIHRTHTNTCSKPCICFISWMMIITKSLYLYGVIDFFKFK